MGTPLTDAAAFDWHPEDGRIQRVDGDFVDAEFARKLEESRNELLMALKWVEENEDPSGYAGYAVSKAERK